MTSEFIEKIKKYCQTNSFEDFDNLGDKFIFYVDWREYDDAIVEYCEDIIQTGDLKAETIYNKEEEADYLTITYKGKETQLKLTDSRDPSLKLINKILLPDYELRFCTITFPSDTLAFMLLPADKWKMIEEQIPKSELDKYFEPIHDDMQMFEREYEG